MATWRERFEELSAENVRQLERWKAGDTNQDQILDSGEDIKEFFRQWGSAQRPNRDNEM